ncbi:MAG: DUF302 domain-containing protein [Gammaproteobacteria bacterium]
MFKFIWNLLALLGLAMVAGCIWLVVNHGSGLQNLRSFDKGAPKVYLDMTKQLLETGNAAEATVWKVKVAEGLSAEEVEETMRFVANEHNIKNVGELPLSEQVSAMTGAEQRFWKIYMFCNPLTAAKMVDYSDAYSAYLPCRVSLVEDKTGELWIYTLNMDMMIHGGRELPADLFEEANDIKDTILDIMNRGAQGEF